MLITDLSLMSLLCTKKTHQLNDEPEVRFYEVLRTESRQGVDYKKSLAGFLASE